ncbi:MAG: DNA topoisomerase IV subunit A [Candidatus Nanohaloarchaeota archaeon QJJ-9]|nr:DNA topoisomerase IV subunit A [Candidatus Nanohaloarchaeota archaeon QJJ-9]
MTELERDEVTKEKLQKLGHRILKQIEEGENPEFEKPVRSRSNVEYDEEEKVLTLGDKKSSREFMNIGHARKFMQTMMIASKCKELIEEGRTASVRELYYQLKHTIPGLDENTLEDQEESDPVIVDLETALDAIREQMHLIADPRGTLFGPIKIEQQGDVMDAMKMGRSGIAIPSIVDDYNFVEHDADYVLVVETAAMVNRLVEENFHEENNAILISTQGQPSRGARRLTNMFANQLDLPIYVFTDGDPWGYYIYSVLRAGSMNLAFESDRLATPEANLVGMTMSDVQEYGLENVTENLKGKPKDKKGGPTKDYKRARDLMDYEWFQQDEWQDQLQTMLDKGIRVEQQALASNNLQFVSETYLPEKIERGDFLP